jgi:hypothetical protein
MENAAPTAPASSPKLTSKDREILAELQKMQPTMGWTVEKYWKEAKNLHGE